MIKLIKSAKFILVFGFVILWNMLMYKLFVSDSSAQVASIIGGILIFYFCFGFILHSGNPKKVEERVSRRVNILLKNQKNLEAWENKK